LKPHRPVVFSTEYRRGVEACFQTLDIQAYACGLKSGCALIGKQNPFVEMGSNPNRNMRIAIEKDLPAIVAIYNTTIATRQSTADTVAVTVESRMDWFRGHIPAKRPLMVHAPEGKVVAWVSFQDFYGRAAYDHTAEISVYVDPAHRGLGLGRTLLTEALEMTRGLDIKTVVGFIFAHNEPSIRLFRSLGFQEWGRLPDVAEMDGTEFSLSILGKRVNA
jgi:L-amino acid N-acyltransferase YncA